MNKFAKVSILVVLLALGTADAQQRRNQKSLIGVFPFNNNQGAHQPHHGDHPADNARAFSVPDVRDSRQGGGNTDLSIGSIAAAGEKCIDKVVMVEETEYDDVVECKHSYSERCHTTYTTDFEPQQEEECQENFVKNCFIEYRKVASPEKIQFCHTPLICEGEGPEECKTVYESYCETSYHEHEVTDKIATCEEVKEEKCEDVTQGYTTEKKCTYWPRTECKTEDKVVKKYTPETKCEKKPRELCGPSGCDPKPGPEQCFDKTETVVQEVCNKKRH